jgi:protein TonB
MKQPIHAVSGRREMTPERIAGIGFVAVLHVIVIWAIVTGLAQKIVRTVISDPFVMIPLKQDPPKTLPPKMPVVKLPSAAPDDTVKVPPQLVVQDPPDKGPVIVTAPPTDLGPVAPSVPDTLAAGIGSTHTTPPYPPLARRLEQQGSVKLNLAISADGVVTAASVVQSSGYDLLDQAAVSWVIQHWRYKPAVRAGQPVAGTSMALVVFSLKNAR